eukprot:TRINITY_DN19075_c0_g1_i2.p1 TRINITY_DN19075_c0_g1~~TRINITY_DN19075_c0_g1_i2.p1  ORF type:complete len:153 (+),score=27.82 TRINITY_DN19075_c0_g1_i2:78-536(+)
MRSLSMMVVMGCLGTYLLSGLTFLSGPAPQKREISVDMKSGAAPVKVAKVKYPTGNPTGNNPDPSARDPLPEGYGIRTGLSDLLKPLNSEAGVTLKEDSIPTILVMVFGIVMLALWFILLLLINNQSVLLPPEDEFDEYVANFLPYFFFGEK